MRRTAILAFTILAALQARAICPEPEPRPCYLFHLSKAVFIGTVLGEKDLAGNKRFDHGTMYTLRVLHRFRGAEQKTIRVFTERNSGGEYLDVGKSYLIFSLEGDADHPLYITCSLAREVRDIRATVEMMNKVVARRGLATIAGRVGGHYGNSKPVPGASIEIHRPAGVKTIRSDTDGNFRIEVPAGNYKVIVRLSDRQEIGQTIYNVSAARAKQLNLKPGQCVDLSFDPRDPPD